MTVHRKEKSGSGLCILTQKGINIKIGDYINKDNNNVNIESLITEITNEKSKNVILGVIYRPPNNKINEFDSHIKNILTIVDKQNKPCYIIGDFNIDLKYEHCKFSTEFFNNMISSGFIPLVTKPTRITRSTATLIDNIFTNMNFEDENNSGILFSDLCDHLPIFHIIDPDYKIINSKTVSKKIRKNRKITDNNLQTFKEKLEMKNWTALLAIDDPLRAYTRNFR